MGDKLSGSGGFIVEPLEKKKRKREFFALIPIGLLFLFLTWVEFKLFGMSRSLPFVHSIFFFGLVNFNIILFLFLMFLIFRNIVKNFAERQGGIIGSTLKNKLIAAFVGFSFVPTALMFLVSVFYINNSFDKWFSDKMSGVLKSSIEVTNAYYVSAKKKNYHFAEIVAKDLEKSSDKDLAGRLKKLRQLYSLDAVEYYPGLFGDRVISQATEAGMPRLPAISLEFLKKGVRQRIDASTIHHFGAGNLVRVVVPAKRFSEEGAVVVSSFIPMSLIAKMDDIAAAYEDFRDIDPLAYPLKSIYLIILFLMTLVILLGGTWFGFYLAKQLSVPLEELGRATKRIAKGDYSTVEKVSGSPEIDQLIENFNRMTRYLESSEKEVTEANANLRKTLAQLDEHSKYIEVVLSNVTTGVISVNNRDCVTMINNHAAKLLEIQAEGFIGRPASEVLSEDHFRIYKEMLGSMKSHKGENIQREVQLNVKGRPVPLQMNLTLLHDQAGRELGRVLVFDDLTVLLNAQRAAAWSEVARRIAHEIKNPLTPIKLAAQRLERKFGEEQKDPAFHESISMIVQQVDDMKNLVNEFSQFARMPKSRPTIANLKQVVDDALVLFREAHKSVAFSVVVDPDLPEFMFDPDQIKRVVTNLVDNAVEATKDLAKPEVSIKINYDSKTKVVKLVTEDNGTGIPRHMMDRIFEPYVTTKDHGTGLGLAIVKRTVEDHNGYIRAFRNQPNGTRIVIELPVVVADTEKQNLAQVLFDSKKLTDQGLDT
ncbi:MAG: HAMP domain-containing protein [Pseudobdellovibrionaceae bacterium]|nr:MAG: HAMP domain-containing protein [Pseudobdellovibrionaceae bacterium]